LGHVSRAPHRSRRRRTCRSPVEGVHGQKSAAAGVAVLVEFGQQEETRPVDGAGGKGCLERLLVVLLARVGVRERDHDRLATELTDKGSPCSGVDLRETTDDLIHGQGRIRTIDWEQLAADELC
jgi:hypothetical protein